MSLAAPISAIEVRSTSAAIPTGWSELNRQDLPAWNNVLRRTEASLYQYPFWNEPYRRMWVTPRYLAWGNDRHPLAFVSILTVGFGPAKIGLVFRGPAQVVPGLRLPQATFRDLLDWARAEGYMFLRFTHSDPQILADLANAGQALNLDAFPYLLDYPVLSSDYIVEQHDSDEETLAGFDREARRKIRRGVEAGYQFHFDDSSAALQQVWHLYQECARRKHFRLERPLSFYVELMRGAQFYNRTRLYTVSLGGKIVGSTLVLRDQTTAHCLLAAFDNEHKNSAAFLHWNSMRDMYRMGARRYNLGPAPGSLARFKGQFCKEPVRYPGPLTIVLKEGLFRLWGRAFVPMAKQLQPMLRKLAFQRAALIR
jgi:hypothetical protein